MADSPLPVRDTLTEIARLLPKDASLEDVQYHLYVRQQIEAGLADDEADRLYERILARPLQLTEYPRSGSVVAELGREDVRESFVYSFRLIYRVATDGIRVLTLIHGSRELRPEMIEEAER